MFVTNLIRRPPSIPESGPWQAINDAVLSRVLVDEPTQERCR